MRHQLIIFAILSLALLAQTATGQIRYESYSNARFDYSIDYPVNLLVPQRESTNGDGRAFLAKKGDAKMLVWGQYNALFDTLTNAYQSDLEERGAGVTYKILLKDSYVISGTKAGKIYYQKTMLSGTDGDGDATFATFTIEYKKSEKAKYDPIVARISKSFKFN